MEGFFTAEEAQRISSAARKEKDAAYLTTWLPASLAHMRSEAERGMFQATLTYDVSSSNVSAVANALRELGFKVTEIQYNGVLVSWN